jgi:uncharacterized protein with NAD-binding domain and iron-sulfur cluster
MDVAIVGGGLAGLSCAVGLASSGLRVTVLEKNAYLGGRARSWRHPVTGDTVDIGPHVVHSEYRNFLGFLERLGTRHLIRWQPGKLITLATYPPTVLRHRPLPPPLSLLPDLARGSGLGVRDLWSNNAPTWRAMKFGEEDVAELDRWPAMEYLRACGVSRRMIDWFWRFACLAVMNVPLEQCSAAALLRVHAELIGRRGLHFGFPTVGLSELYVAQAARHADVVLNTEVRSLEEVKARFIVCAVSPQDLQAIAPNVADTAPFEPSPYISTYLWFDRKITRERFWALLWSPERLNTDFYDVSNIRGGERSVIATNLIYSHRAHYMDDDAIVRSTLDEIALFAPEVRQARLLHADVHRIPMAIACPKPGTEVARPVTRTALPGVLLAGDWTRTQLPSSMESAVRSGFLAAEAIWAAIGAPRRLALSPRPTQGIAGLVRLATKVVRARRPSSCSASGVPPRKRMKALLTKVSPDATDMIRADHSRVLATFHRYKTSTAAATKRALVGSICLALEVHAQIEEEIFYPAMGSVDTPLVGKLIPEHDKMRSLIGALRGMEPNDAQYDSILMELMREVIHHVAEEETVLLPEAERVLGERLSELGARMLKRRLQLMAPHAGELTRHKARALPKSNLVVMAGAVVGAAFLFNRLRRA